MYQNIIPRAKEKHVCTSKHPQGCGARLAHGLETIWVSCRLAGYVAKWPNGFTGRNPGCLDLPRARFWLPGCAYASWAHRFPRSAPGETRARFANRTRKVEHYMNLSEFTAQDGGGLASLAESLRERFQRLALLQGERLRT